MRPRVKKQLAEFGCTATIEDLRAALIAAKDEGFPDLTDEDLAFSRHEAEDYCKRVRTSVGGNRLPRVFILKNLVSLRKNGHLKRMPKSMSSPLG